MFLKRNKKEYQIRNIRQVFLLFGKDLSHLSDEELTNRLIAASKKIASAGATTKEAIRALSR